MGWNAIGRQNSKVSGEHGANTSVDEQKANIYDMRMDEGRKRVIGIMAAILASLHMRTADDLFGGPQGSPRTDQLIAASIQWAERIMEKIDDVFPQGSRFFHSGWPFK
jgi:hypothetical protein